MIRDAFWNAVESRANRKLKFPLLPGRCIDWALTASPCHSEDSSCTIRPASSSASEPSPTAVAHEEPGLAKYGQIARFIEPMECLPVEKIPDGDL